VTVRLLDFSGDKVPPFLAGGPTGVTALLAAPDALAAQVRAIVDVGPAVQLRIMVPMVRSPDELVAVRAVAGSLVGSVPVGAMVETVAAGSRITELAGVADFFSIGTNDLTGEVLGLDRRDPVARPELAAHPTVLSIIERVAAVADRPVSVCGDSAAHPVTLPLLVGAGVRAVSVAAARVDETRYLLRRLDTGECRRVFAEALRLRDAAEVAELIRDRIGVSVP
jgi:multiphosphoryl transfer protein